MTKFLSVFLFLWMGFGLSVSAQDAPKIQYISADHVYLNIGMDQGVHVGDTLRLNETDFLVVVSVSSSRAATQANRPLPETFTNMPVPAPYLAKLELRLNPPKEEKKAVEGGFQQDKWKTGNQETKKKTEPFVRGLFQVQQIHQSFTVAGKTYSYNQPGYTLYLTIPKLFNDNWGFKIRYRALYTNLPYGRDYDKNKSFLSSFDNRIYEVSTYFSSGEDGTYFQAGRFSARTLWSAGIIDGALYEVPVLKTWQVGVLGGTSPDYREMAFQSRNPKYGFYAQHKTGDNQTESVGWIGEYQNGTLSREFISHDVSWYSDSWSWSQSGDLDINRGWKGKRDNAVVLSNLYVYGRYRPFDWLQPYASANIRRPIWTADVRSVADTLFDRKYQQSVNLGVRSDFKSGLYTDGSVGYRHRNGDPFGTLYLGFQTGLRNVLQSGWSANSNTSGYFNEVYGGWTQTFSVAGMLPYEFNSYSSVTIQGYTLGGESSPQMDYLFSESLSRQVLDRIYLTGSAEWGTGKTLDLFRFFFSGSYRF
ncbi:MAG: hypothetical protein LCH54_10075 [Bacteroidetes bacterium]|nr:hypothetical protein [Bacteroidota bacterium]